MLITFKMLLMSLLVSFSSPTSPSDATSGCIMDILQVGRNAIVVNVDKAQLPPALLGTTLTVSLSDEKGEIICSEVVSADMVTVSLRDTSAGIYRLILKADNRQLEVREFEL